MAAEQDIALIKSKLDQKTVSESQIIPVDFCTGTGKLLKTINSVDAGIVFVMKDEEYEIKFDSPIYISKISLEIGEFQSVKGMRLIANDLLSSKVGKVAISVDNVSGNTVSFILGKVITSFSLHRGSTGYFGKKLKKVQIFGILPADFEKFEIEFQDLQKAKEEILSLATGKLNSINIQSADLDAKSKKFATDLKATEERIVLLTAEKEKLEETVDELTGELEQLNSAIATKNATDATLTAKATELEQRSISLNSELSQKTETLNNVNIGISQADEKLKSLVNNVNVFTEEFSGFVDQGTKQVKIYLVLAAIPLALLCIVVYNLFHGAVDLSLKYELIPKIDLLTLLMTRLPFVAISALIVGVSIKTFFFLVNRIITIHQQRLDLAKIAIIAKDVSDASAEDQKMPASEIYDAKTYLKMGILKSYLADQINDYSYSPRKKKGTVPPMPEDTKSEVPLLAK